MWRRLLIYGLISTVIAVAAVAYIAGVTPAELAGGPPPPPPQKFTPFPKPAYVDKDLATLEAAIEAAITEDLPAMAELQAKRQRTPDQPLIPHGKDAVVWKTAFEEHVDYRKRAVQVYRNGSRDPKSAQPAAIEFLDSYGHAAAWQRGDWKAIREQGDAAIKAGSSDPLVVAWHTRAKQSLKEIQPLDAFATYKKLTSQLGDGAYPPPLLKFLLTAWNADIALNNNIADTPGPSLRRIAFQEAATFLAKESGSANPAVLLSLVYNVLRFNKDAADQRLELFQACLMEPKIDPYIHHMLGGEYYQKLAWSHRGGGYANSVTKEGWAKFGELMPRAARHFRRAWFLHPELPFAAEEMIMVSTAGGDDSWSPDEWFHASVAAQLDYREAYRSYMFVMMPRWRGSHEEIADIARLCVDTGRWDTTVPGEAETAIRLIGQDRELNELTGKNPAAERIAEAYIDAFAAAKERGDVKPEDFAKTLASMTAILVQAGNYQAARRAFEIGPEPNDSWWSMEQGIGYRYSMGLAWAMTGPAEHFVKSVHEFLTREAVETPWVAEVEEMQKRLDDARGLDSDPKSVSFYDIAGRMLDQLKAYAAGEWVDLTFDPQMTLWTSRAAKYELIDPVTLRLTGTEQIPHIQLKPLTRFAPPYMVEAEVKFVSTASGEARPGIVIGASKVTSRDQKPGPQVLAAGPSIMAYFDYRQRKGQPSMVGFLPDPQPADGFDHLAIRRYPRQTQMFAMHGRLVTDRSDEPANDFILFGDSEHLGVTGEAIFRNLRIRRAPPESSGLNTESPDSLPALMEAIAYYPECPEAQKHLAGALSEQGRCAEAIEHIAKARAVYPKINDLNRIEGVARCGLGEFEAALAAFRKDYEMFSYSTWSFVHEAWVLATAPDEKLRNGRKANELLTAVRPRFVDRSRVWSFILTEAAVAAENGKLDEAKTLASEAEEAADSDYRRGIAQRVRAVIDEGRPYRMPATGEIPPPPAPPKRTKTPPPTEGAESQPAAAE